METGYTFRMPTLAQNLGATSLAPFPQETSGVMRLLEKSGWLRDLGEGQLTVLARHLGAYRALKGGVIFREGAREPFLCVVSAGKVAILKEDSSHAKQGLVTLGPGKVFGALSLVDGEPRSATVTALEDSVLLVLTRAGFEKLSDDFPRLALQLLMRITRTVSQKLRQTSGILVEHLKK